MEERPEGRDCGGRKKKGFLGEGREGERERMMPKGKRNREGKPWAAGRTAGAEQEQGVLGRNPQL